MKKGNWARFAIAIILIGVATWYMSGVSVWNPHISNNSQENPAGEFVLAVSWQPAFCEIRPNRPECRSQHPNRFDASNFSLHGLWPQPRSNIYCAIDKKLVRIDKSGKWHDLPKLKLSAELRKELQRKMPGYRSYLHRHEWVKHGSCIPGMSQEKYFEISLRLLDSLNESELAGYFRENVGNEMHFRKVAKLADRSFGNGAGMRIEMDCYRVNGSRIIGQLEFSLSGELNQSSGFAPLLLEGAIEGKSCPFGRIDQVGLQ